MFSSTLIHDSLRGQNHTLPASWDFTIKEKAGIYAYLSLNSGQRVMSSDVGWRILAVGRAAIKSLVNKSLGKHHKLAKSDCLPGVLWNTQWLSSPVWYRHRVGPLATDQRESRIEVYLFRDWPHWRTRSRISPRILSTGSGLRSQRLTSGIPLRLPQPFTTCTPSRMTTELAVDREEEPFCWTPFSTLFSHTAIGRILFHN